MLSLQGWGAGQSVPLNESEVDHDIRVSAEASQSGCGGFCVLCEDVSGLKEFVVSIK